MDSVLKEKICSQSTNRLFLRADPHFKWCFCTEKIIGIHQTCLPCSLAENITSVSFPLKWDTFQNTNTVSKWNILTYLFVFCLDFCFKGNDKCVTMWDCTWLFRENDFPQTGHWNGFSPVCVRLWITRCALEGHCKPHVSHVCILHPPGWELRLPAKIKKRS